MRDVLSSVPPSQGEVGRTEGPGRRGCFDNRDASTPLPFGAWRLLRDSPLEGGERRGASLVLIYDIRAVPQGKVAPAPGR